MRTLTCLTTAALALGLTGVARGQAFVLDVDPTPSSFTFGGTTNFGAIVGTPPDFDLDGTVGLDLVFGCDGLPSEGAFAGGDAVTVPGTLMGEIPNAIPFLPPVATLTIQNLHLAFEAPPFAIAPDGTFTADLQVVVLSGVVNFVPLIGDPGSFDITGFTSGFQPTPGQVVLGPGTVRVVMAVDLAVPINTMDVTGQIDLVGTLDATGPRTATFCDSSDGSLSACPCGNVGTPDSGCDLPQATGGVQLRLAAQRFAPTNSATLTACGYPAMGTPTSIAIRAPALEAAPVVFGDGLRCIGVPLVRLAPVFASGGAATHVVAHGAMAGSGLFHYQLWFRSTPITFCDAAAAFNLSNGVSLSW